MIGNAVESMVIADALLAITADVSGALANAFAPTEVTDDGMTTEVSAVSANALSATV